jgi:hypothetical protein
MGFAAADLDRAAAPIVTAAPHWSLPDRRGGTVVAFRELDERVPFAQQLGENTGPIVFLEHLPRRAGRRRRLPWGIDRRRRVMQHQPGYISTQLHRGIAGSTRFIKAAVWASVAAMRTAVSQPEFQARLANSPQSAVALPHIFTKRRRPRNLRWLTVRHRPRSDRRVDVDARDAMAVGVAAAAWVVGLLVAPAAPSPAARDAAVHALRSPLQPTMAAVGVSLIGLGRRLA